MLRRHRNMLVVVIIGLLMATVPAQNKQINQIRQAARKAASLCWKRGDYQRRRGNYESAKKEYQKSVDKWKEANNYRFAAVTVQMVELCDAMMASRKKPKDGIYAGTAQGYSGNVALEVRIRRGRIRAMRFTEQRESRALKSLKVVPSSIIRKQSPSVDAVTGATVTSYAVMSATMNALEKADPPEAQPKP